MARNSMAKAQYEAFKVEVTVTPTGSTEAAEVEKSAGEVHTFVRTLRKSVQEEKRQITCVAMVADEVDAHGDMFTPEAVEFAANSFLTSYNVTKEIGLNHSGDRPDVDMIGSWFTETGGDFDGLDVPPNSWVAKMRINEDETWEAVKSGAITGLSIEGPCWGSEVQKQVSKSVDSDDSESSEDSGPKRIFTKADPRNLDLVNEGANLKFLVWKAKDKMDKQETAQAETPEIIETEAVKGKEAEAPEAQPETKTEEAKSAEVEEAPEKEVETAKASEAPEAKPVEEQLIEALKAKRLTPARAAELLKLQESLNSFISDAGILSEEAPEEVAKAAPQAPAFDADKLGELMSTAVEKAMKPLSDRILELEGLRGTSAARDNDEVESPEVEVKKSVFSGIFNGM